MRIPTLALLVAAATAPGCVSIHAGAGSGRALVRVDGPVNAHVSAGAPVRISPPVQVGVLRGTSRRHELVSVDVWPLFGVGVGVVGARASVLGLEVGVGTLGYDADPEPDAAAPPEPEEPEASPDPDDEAKPADEAEAGGGNP